jgi:hypothetical protein
LEWVKSELEDPTLSNFPIYRHNFIFTLLRALKNQFPKVQAQLGEENFRFFVREFIYSVPLKEPNLELIGRAFPKYLKSRAELKEESQPIYLLAKREGKKAMRSMERKKVPEERRGKGSRKRLGKGSFWEKVFARRGARRGKSSGKSSGGN